jgi:hypothetical protein
VTPNRWVGDKAPALPERTTFEVDAVLSTTLTTGNPVDEGVGVCVRVLVLDCVCDRVVVVEAVRDCVWDWLDVLLTGRDLLCVWLPVSVELALGDCDVVGDWLGV